MSASNTPDQLFEAYMKECWIAGSKAPTHASITIHTPGITSGRVLQGNRGAALSTLKALENKARQTIRAQEAVAINQAMGNFASYQADPTKLYTSTTRMPAPHLTELHDVIEIETFHLQKSSYGNHVIRICDYWRAWIESLDYYFTKGVMERNSATQGIVKYEEDGKDRDTSKPTLGAQFRYVNKWSYFEDGLKSQSVIATEKRKKEECTRALNALDTIEGDIQKYRGYTDSLHAKVKEQNDDSFHIYLAAVHARVVIEQMIRASAGKTIIVESSTTPGQPPQLRVR